MNKDDIIGEYYVAVMLRKNLPAFNTTARTYERAKDAIINHSNYDAYEFYICEIKEIKIC